MLSFKYRIYFYQQLLIENPNSHKISTIRISWAFFFYVLYEAIMAIPRSPSSISSCKVERVIQDDTPWLHNVYLDLCNFIIVMTRRENLHNNDNNGDLQ